MNPQQIIFKKKRQTSSSIPCSLGRPYSMSMSAHIFLTRYGLPPELQTTQQPLQAELTSHQDDVLYIQFLAIKHFATLFHSQTLSHLLPRSVTVTFLHNLSCT